MTVLGGSSVAKSVRAAIVGGAVVALTLVAIHTRPVRSLVRDRLIAWAQSSAGIRLSLDDLSYNLLTLDIRLTGVTAAAEREETPFFSAQQVHVNLPWRAVFSALSVDQIELIAPRVDIVRAPDGTLNLPATSERATGNSLTSLAVSRLRIEQGAVRYDDQRERIAAVIDDVAIALEPGADGVTRGPMTAGRGVRLQIGDAEMQGSLGGELSYDGTTVSLANLAYAGDLARLRVDGRLTIFGPEPTTSLKVAATTSLDEISTRFKIEPPASGVIALDGAIEGALAGPTATLALTSDAVGWQHLRAERLTARAVATTEFLNLDDLRARVAEGSLTLSGRLAFNTMRMTAQGAWSDVSASTVLGPYAPAPIGAQLTGSVSLDASLSNILSGLQLTARSRNRAVRVSRRIGLDGELGLDVSNGEWRLSASQVVGDAVSVSGRLSGRLDAAQIADSTLGGTLALSADRPAPLFALLGTAGVALPTWSQPQTGRVAVAARLSGTLGAPRADADGQIRDIRIAEAAPLNADVSLTANTNVLTLTSLDANAGGNTLRGTATVRLPSRTIAGEADLDLLDFGAFGPQVTAWSPAGHLSAHAIVSGTSAKPTVRADVAGSGLAAAGQQLGDLVAAVAYEGATIAAPSIVLTQPGSGRLVASGGYALADGRSTLTLRAEHVQVAPVETPSGAWPLTTTIDGHLDASGTVQRPSGSGQLSLTGLAWNAAGVDRADVDIALEESGVQLVLRVPQLAIDAKASVEPRAPYGLTASASAHDTSLVALLSAAGFAQRPEVAGLDGALTASANVSGRLNDTSSLGGDVTLERLLARSGDALVQLEQPSRATYTTSRASVDALRLRTGDTILDLSGEIAPAGTSGLTLSASGRLIDLQPWLRVAGLPGDLTIDGALGSTVQVNGSFERLTLSGSMSLDDGQLTWPGYPSVTNVNTHVSIDEGIVETSALTARSGDISVDGRLRLPLRFLEDSLPRAILAGLSGAERAALVQLRADNITPAALAPFTGEGALDQLTGRASLQAALRADAPAVDQVTGSITLTELDLTAATLPIRQARPTRLDVAAGRVHVADWAWNVADSAINVAGNAQLTETQAVDARVDGRLDLRVIGAFLPSMTAAGTGDLSVAIRGTTLEPIAEGRITVQSGELRVADPPLGLSGVDGAIELRPNRLEIAQLAGTLNGGRFTAAGALEYRGFAMTGGSVSLTATGIALNAPAGLRTEVDASLTAAMGERIQLSGKVDVVRGAYREPISLAATLAAAARARSAAANGDVSPMLARVDLNIAVASREDLVVDNNYGRMDLGLDVRLAGTAAAPALIGRAAIREGGLLYLGGRTYLVERGLIDFSDPRAIVPELDLSARTRINGVDENGAPTDYDITMSIAGTAETLETTLASDPTRSQADIVSLLATGRLADQAGGAGGAVAAEQVLGYLSGEALGFAARAVGLDSIRFEQGVRQEALESDPSIAGEVNPAQRLTISRRLSRAVEVTLSQNLSDTGLLTWVVSFAPRRNVEIRTVSLDDRSRSYDVRHDVSFGGPSLNAALPKSTTPSRVAAVRLTGELVLPRNDVERSLHLQTGDRLDFYRWQQDRDRLRAFYLDRGYREVRVSARQSPSTGPGEGSSVELDYDVQPGPLTVLDIDGFSLPSDVVRELERIWSNSVVDVALVDDIVTTVRRRLAERGYLRAAVRAQRVATDAASKRIQVHIDPGTRSVLRTLRVTGNTRVSTAEIDAAAVRVGVDAWLTPKVLADEVASLYEARGLLGAAVTAGPIDYTGETAVLPVLVNEGVPFTIGRLVIDGAHVRTEAVVRQELGLSEGDAYVPEALTRARTALARAYARDGFNAMRGDTEVSVDRARGVVDVKVIIDEGRRQVLDAVTVNGAAGVRAGVIDDALKLATGGPVDLDRWYAGRRKLFQTGLFRRVDIEAVPVDRSSAPQDVEPVRAEVTLVRRAPWRLRYGVSVTDTEAPIAEQGRTFGGGLNANLERFGLFGWPGSAVLSARYNNDQRVARGTFAWPSLFGRPVASRLFIGRSRDEVSGQGITAFITDRTTVTGEQRIGVGRHVQVAYAYQSERNHLFDPNADPDDPFALDERWSQSRLTSSVVVDTRDEPFAPTRGQLHASNVEFGLAVLGRNGRFLKYSAQEFVFVKLTPRLISASGVRFNSGKGFGQDLILSERFFAGGMNTVRGYAENALGGYDVFGDPIPGQAAVVLNEELRFGVFRWIGGAAFVDAGNVYRRARDLSFTGLQVGAGVGLRLATPVGLLRVDVAAPVPRNERPFKWTFGFGHIF